MELQETIGCHRITRAPTNTHTINIVSTPMESHTGRKHIIPIDSTPIHTWTLFGGIISHYSPFPYDLIYSIWRLNVMRSFMGRSFRFCFCEANA